MGRLSRWWVAAFVLVCGCGATTVGGSDANDGGGSGAGRGGALAGNGGGAAGRGAGGGATSQGGAGNGGGDVGVGEAGAGDGTTLPAGRRLPLPCTAPFPTGYCFVSDTGDYIGGGKSSSASGAASVTLSANYDNGVEIALKNSGNGDYWSVDFVAGAKAILTPGLYEGAQRFPFQEGTAPGLSVDGNGAGCNMLTGKFSIEELARDPVAGVTRFSATFEQHCEGGVPALRGVINFQASGVPDPTPTADTVIALSGKVFRVAYDASANLAYGLDATNRTLSKIDLASGTAKYADVVQVPNDACVDEKRGRLFVVNKGSSVITEYDTADLTAVRDITWAGTDEGPTETHFKIYCAPDKLYVVDGAWSPALFTVEGLDGAAPVATDHTAQVAGVGGLAVNSAATDLYYWNQVGWSAGLLSTFVSRLLTTDLSEIDKSSTSVPSFSREPLDAPLLLDETRGLVFVKNKIFDVLNLSKVIYTLPSVVDTFDGAAENAYALDATHGLLATKNFVYELSRYDIVAPTLTPTADQEFFDADGTLWFLSVADGSLQAQIVTH